MNSKTNFQKNISVIGAGPSGLFAAEILAKAGCAVNIYDQKAMPARKFLMAGRGGLNITHSEDINVFLTRYNEAQENLSKSILNFTPTDMRQWCDDLGQETFVGSSGRVFPRIMKASPLLRAWVKKLEKLGVSFHMSHMWKGWDDTKNLLFETNESHQVKVMSDATLLCLGGASWPSLGSDGVWQKYLLGKGINLSGFEPSNCGFYVDWSPYIRDKFSGTPLKGISLSHKNHTVMGEIMITDKGVEGGAIYALSSYLRTAIKNDGMGDLSIDLRPNLAIIDIKNKLMLARGRNSFSTWLQKSLNLSPLSIALLRENDKDIQKKSLDDIVTTIKSVQIRTTSPFSIDRAISSAGGVPFSEMNENFMIRSMPGVFAAGEMLDWEAPTGGYLLQACFATGKAAANGILDWINQQKLA